MLRGRGEGHIFEASAYHNWFSNFIYEAQTGDIEDGLPVFQFGQADARYYGFELQGTVTLANFNGMSLIADGQANYVHANIKNVGPAPRIPPMRLQGGLALNGSKVDLRGKVDWSNNQTRTTAFETQTNSFTLVNAEINYRPWGNTRPLSFALSANNIFDVDARRHASVLKDFAPLAGRDIRVTARASF